MQSWVFSHQEYSHGPMHARAASKNTTPKIPLEYALGLSRQLRAWKWNPHQYWASGSSKNQLYFLFKMWVSIMSVVRSKGSRSSLVTTTFSSAEILSDRTSWFLKIRFVINPPTRAIAATSNSVNLSILFFLSVWVPWNSFFIRLKAITNPK